MPKPTWKGGGGLAEGIGIRFAGVPTQKAPRQQIPNESAQVDVVEAIIVDAVRTARGKRA